VNIPISTRGPLTGDEVLAQFADETVWIFVTSETYLPVLTPDPRYPGLEMLSLFVEHDAAELALQHLKTVRPDISKDLVMKNIKLHGSVRLYVKHSRAPTKLRFLIHSSTEAAT
jgi:hypothetical protein